MILRTGKRTSAISIVSDMPKNYGLDASSIPIAQVNSAIIAGAISTPDIRPKKKLQNRNLTALKKDSVDEVVDALVQVVTELQRTVDIIWDRNLPPTEMATDGLPKHGAMCPLFNGQYLRIISAGSGVPVLFSHGLQRKPVGALWVYLGGSGVVKVAIIGDSSTTPITPSATSSMVSFIPYQALGIESVCILF